MDEIKEIKKLLMQVGFGVEGATIAAKHLVSNGVTIWNEQDLCEDNVMCCDDDCQKCAKRIYKAYCRERDRVSLINKILNGGNI